MFYEGLEDYFLQESDQFFFLDLAGARSLLSRATVSYSPPPLALALLFTVPPHRGGEFGAGRQVPPFESRRTYPAGWIHIPITSVGA